MDILFCEAPIEEDINSILSLLTLNEEHMRVKKIHLRIFSYSNRTCASKQCGIRNHRPNHRSKRAK